MMFRKALSLGLLALCLTAVWFGFITLAGTQAQQGLVQTNPAVIIPGTGINGAGTVTAPSLVLPSVVFAGLGTPANGSEVYCSDCTVTTAASCPTTQASCVCANTGTGAFARRAAGAWYCTF